MVNKTKSAFTLAEVLITLVIIGIVAALTISAVINTYVERTTISKVKKGLSTLAQAKKLAEAQNGSVVGWDYGDGWSAQTATDFWKYLKPYISVAKDCGASTDCYHSYVKGLNGSNCGSYGTEDIYYKFVLADGGVMWFRTENKCTFANNYSCALFFYDVNGGKKPNVVGKDVFSYRFYPDSVIPYPINECNKDTVGWGCANYIIKNDNMNYLHQ